MQLSPQLNENLVDEIVDATCSDRNGGGDLAAETFLECFARLWLTSHDQDALG